MTVAYKFGHIFGALTLMTVVSRAGPMGDSAPVFVLSNPFGWVYGFTLSAAMWAVILSVGFIALHKTQDADHSTAITQQQ